MATRDLTVRNIPEEVLTSIKEQAKDNLRSMNSEIIVILRDAAIERGEK